MLPDLDKAMVTFLVQQRGLAHMTQTDLAVAITAAGLGVSWSRSQVAAVESGRRRSLRFIEIIAICRVFGLTLVEVLREIGMTEGEVATLIGVATRPRPTS